MKNNIKLGILFLLFFFIFIVQGFAGETEKYDAVLKGMRIEIDRSTKDLKLENNKPPFYIDYIVKSTKSKFYSFTCGKDGNDSSSALSNVYVRVKVGDYNVDEVSYKKDLQSFDFRNFEDEIMFFFVTSPIDLAPEIIRYRLWYITDHKYKKAIDMYTKKKETKTLDVKEEDVELLPDFTKGTPYSYKKINQFKDIDTEKINSILKKLSGKFKDKNAIFSSSISLNIQDTLIFFINSEGSEGYYNFRKIVISCNASTILDDGNFYSNSTKNIIFNDGKIPDEKELTKEVDEFIKVFLKYSHDAKPLDSTYIGPVLMCPGAGAKYLGENLTKLITSDRKAYEKNTLVLLDRLNKKILPRGTNVVDKPNLKKFKGDILPEFNIDLEGTKPQQTIIVQDGKFKKFLTYKVPIKNFPKSNGHAFRYNSFDSSLMPATTNLVITSTKGKSYSDLLAKFKALCRDDDLKYGLVIEDTGVYKYNIKSGKKELLKNFIKSKASPLNALNKIEMLGNNSQIYLVKDKGMHDYSFVFFDAALVPKGTIIAPSILVSEMEFKKKRTQNIPKPILDPPE